MMASEVVQFLTELSRTILEAKTLNSVPKTQMTYELSIQKNYMQQAARKKKSERAQIMNVSGVEPKNTVPKTVLPRT